MNSAPPNLYHFATSELSQDATLAYLLSWADANHATDNTGMHMLGRGLLNMLLQQHGRALPEAASVTVKTQVHHIDVLVLIEYTDSIPLALIIEDKTFTGVRNPFNKYKQSVERHYSIEAANILVTVISLGNQFLYPDPERDFQLFRRAELLAVLQRAEYAAINNTILQNFKAHYAEHHKIYGTHRSNLHPSKWDSPRMWEGYFQHLCALPEAEAPFWHYGYAANKSGGTWWCASRVAGTFSGYNVYLQLEYSNKAVPSSGVDGAQCLLVFKLGPVVDKNERNPNIARSFYALLDAAAVRQGYRTESHPGYQIIARNKGQVLKRPLQLKRGEYVSCGLVVEGDWFLGGDREVALGRLREFYEFLLGVVAAVD